MQALGVVDVDGNDVPENELLAHALSNAANNGNRPDNFHIRRSSAFVNEYARKDEATGQRSDGGPSNANHLLGTFPTLFPYGTGGLEVGRPIDVPYETHVRWALRYGDRRFRKDLYFVFQVFGVIQKRQVCRSASLQIKRSSFIRNEHKLRALKPSDLLAASREETRGTIYSNPAVRELRSQLSAVRVKVQGTDESRQSIRPKVWGMIVKYNPPNLWVTVNPNDSQDPIAQVFTGEQINLDDFMKLGGPSATERAINIASDPFAGAQFFHFMVQAVLEELFGIRVKKGPGARSIERTEGIVGMVRGYIGVVEAQGRGTLHLHVIIWLQGAPTSQAMRMALLSSTFRDKIRQYIQAIICADFQGAECLAADIKSIPPTQDVGYSRPIDPRHNPHYAQESQEFERSLARTVQLHTCTLNTCLKLSGDRYVCKRRAPFPLSDTDWIGTDGKWGPRRICAFINNFCPALLQCIRANHDIKLILDGVETKSITWYITNYATKKQQRSSNTSALLARRLAYHKSQEKRSVDSININKRLIQRCANTLTRDREFGAPEVVSYLMGWGDRYESHHYVTIYWDSAINALKTAYPALNQKT